VNKEDAGREEEGLEYPFLLNALFFSLPALLLSLAETESPAAATRSESLSLSLSLHPSLHAICSLTLPLSLSVCLSLCLSLANRGSILVVSCTIKLETPIRPPPGKKGRENNKNRVRYAAVQLPYMPYMPLSRTRILTNPAAAARHHHMTTASTISQKSCIYLPYIVNSIGH
jgi:hypothetical protein